MIRGLDKFRDHFYDFKDSYILIGGSACDLLMNEAGLAFRPTEDLDIVLCVEAINEEFVSYFWDFINEGGYQIKKNSNGDNIYYRFEEPTNEEFPYMLEILSRNSDTIGDCEPGTFVPMTVDEEIVSLSAIVLDDEFYEYITKHKYEVEGITLVNQYSIIALKARAWVDLTRRKARGEEVQSHHIGKHKMDIFRLSDLLPASENFRVQLPQSLSDDIRMFVDTIRKETSSPKVYKLGNRAAFNGRLDQIIRIFCSS